MNKDTGRHKQLALVEQYIRDEGRTALVIEDIRDAFTQVPLRRLQDVTKRKLPEDVMRLIEMIIDNDIKTGLRQGSPLSPLLMNIYLDHFLDRPWNKLHPDLPLIRTVDDLLILCDTVAEAHDAYADLEKMLRPAGMPLKGTEETSIKNLARGDKARWLGYEISMQDGQLAYAIGERAWKNLEINLQQARVEDHPSIVAYASILGWIGQLGPSYEHTDVGAAYERIQATASELAFDEVPPYSELHERWRLGAAKWNEIRKGLCS